jgi:hypothetical protein
MKKILSFFILIFILGGCSFNNEYTSKSVMNKLHRSNNLEGKYMGDIIEEFGKPYEVEDSIITGEFNYRDLSYPFKDSLSVTFIYMRPFSAKYYSSGRKKNDVVVIMFIQDQYTLNTPMEAIWNVYKVFK